MVAGYFTPGQGESFDYEDLQRRRRLAEALIQQGTDYSPVQSWTQGAARLAQALSGALNRDYANELGKQGQKAFEEKQRPFLDALMGGGAQPASPSGVAPSPLTASAGANLPGDMDTWASAIRKKESAGSGDYAAIGPTHPKLGRALGAYQVMEANIGPWSREALGREVTPDEFIRNPQIQDQIFQHKFGQYVQKFGNPQDAASAWFTGRPMAQGANARDVLGTTGAQYVADFNRNIGAPGAQAGMTPDGMPTSPVPSNAPPMAYAPGQQAIAAAAPQQPPARGQQLAQAVAPTSPPIPAPQPSGNVGAAMAAILSDPRFSPQQKAQAMQLYTLTQKDEGVSPVDLGDRIALMNKRGQVIRELPKTRDGADWEIVKDEYGNPVGSFNKRTNQRQMFNEQPQRRDTITTVDGREVPVPAGLSKDGRKQFESEIAKSDAQTLQNAPGAFSTLAETQQKIAGLIKNEKGLREITSPLGSVWEMVPGSDARSTRARLNQLVGDTFLAAFESLKGGGQITEVEGRKAQQAKARLDDPRIGFDEYMSALKDFHDAIYSGMEKLSKLPGMQSRKIPPRLNFGTAKDGAQAESPSPMQGWTVEVIP